MANSSNDDDYLDEEEKMEKLDPNIADDSIPSLYSMQVAPQKHIALDFTLTSNDQKNLMGQSATQAKSASQAQPSIDANKKTASQSYSQPDLKTYSGGKIYIKLDSNQSFYEAGSTLTGVINVKQQRNFRTKHLELRLIGEERTFVQKEHEETYIESEGQTNSKTTRTFYSEHAGKASVANLFWIISPCINKVIVPGQYQYPFKIHIPDWLPASFVFQMKTELAYASIKYYLVAQFVPINEQDWANPADKVLSSYRTSQDLLISHALRTLPKVNLTKKIQQDIGGLLGLGSSKFSASVQFQKNEFNTNEPMKIHVTVDNTECRKNVKEIKIKLFRKYSISTNGQFLYGAQDKQVATSSGQEYVVKGWNKGCPSKTKRSFDLQAQIPKSDIGFTMCNPYVNFNADDCRLAQAFTCSVQGKLFDVQYELRCVIKHDCWNEFGEGYKVSIPIKIMHPPIIKVPTEMKPFIDPGNKQPVVAPELIEGQISDCTETNNDYKDMMKKSQDEFGKCEPQVLSDDQIREERATIKKQKRDTLTDVVQGMVTEPMIGCATYQKGTPLTQDNWVNQQSQIYQTGQPVPTQKGQPIMMNNDQIGQPVIPGSMVGEPVVVGVVTEPMVIGVQPVQTDYDKAKSFFSSNSTSVSKAGQPVKAVGLGIQPVYKPPANPGQSDYDKAKNFFSQKPSSNQQAGQYVIPQSSNTMVTKQTPQNSDQSDFEKAKNFFSSGTATNQKPNIYTPPQGQQIKAKPLPKNQDYQDTFNFFNSSAHHHHNHNSNYDNGQHHHH